MFKIIKYSMEYRDDMFYCYLLAKDALGDTIHLRDDLFDIQKHYFDKGDMFWIAIDDNNRVAGMVGTNTTSKTDLWLKRLFIRPDMKRKGIAYELLAVVKEYAKSKGIISVHTRFNDNYTEAAYFYLSQSFIESEHSNGLRHFIKKIQSQKN